MSGLSLMAEPTDFLIQLPDSLSRQCLYLLYLL